MKHGGNVHLASRLLKKPVESLIDFSASINPLGPSPRALRAVQRSADMLSHYPDPDCTQLRRALASHLNQPVNGIVIANGSTELIHVIPLALRIRHALIVGPTFSEYAKAVGLAQGRCTFINASRRDDYRPPTERILPTIHAASRSRMPVDALFLCHPNSPTGQVCEQVELTSVIRHAQRSNLWTILDESFLEYGGTASMGALVRLHSRLIVLRSFTKFYALPGLRIGYAIAAVRVANMLRKYLPTWSVGTIAQDAARAALLDRAHSARSLAYMDRERARFIMKLSKLPGVRLIPSHCNFMLLEFSSVHVKRSAIRLLGRQGILVRDCGAIPGLSACTIRVAVKAAAENDRLVNALRRLLERTPV